MPFVKYSSTNLAQAELAAGITSGGATLQLVSGFGSLFPSTFPFKGILEKRNVQGQVTQREQVTVTNRVGDTLTITRATGSVPLSWDASTQSSSAYAFAAGDSFSHVVTAEQIDDIQTETTRLNADKVNVAGGTRTSLTASRILATNGSGVE